MATPTHTHTVGTTREKGGGPTSGVAVAANSTIAVTMDTTAAQARTEASLNQGQGETVPVVANLQRMEINIRPVNSTRRLAILSSKVLLLVLGQPMQRQRLGNPSEAPLLKKG